ncbi:MAG TPA: D-2-hydroxyacid dehydrogenase [Gemmatimonadaceae bacterium]|nr:D-2-hydroxyacid dehydrogenase [Gemmatimonadaceae bacterium]
MTQPLTPRRILIGATAHAELSERLRAARADLEVRGKPYLTVTADDLAWADTYVGFKRPPLPTMGNVRWVHCTGAGVDSWLYPNELPRELLLTRTSESFGVYIAEWALARALACRQQILELAEHQRKHEWAPRDVGYVRGSRAVVVGTGDVGAHIGRLFAALGAEVCGVSRSGRGDSGVFSSLSRVSELRTLAASADWLIVTVPLTSDTRGLISREILSACRGAVLINAGRGATVDESAIPAALDAGWLSGAILDVFEVEPLPADSPLWDDRRVMISPHSSGPTTADGAVAGFLECLAEIEQGQTPTRTVDREREY